ncbi:hypothetical protein GCM10009087_21830 [Sphingomonas oligophenolica]
MPPARLETREDSSSGRGPRSISGAVFDFVVIPFLTALILLMIYEIASQLWLGLPHVIPMN